MLCVLVVGCASYGKKIDLSSVDKIQKGVTTEAQVKAMLGNPMSVGITAEGKKFMMYMYTQSQTKASTFIPIVGAFVGGADTQTQTLQIWVDENDVVTTYTYNTSNSELNTGLLSQ